MYLFSHVSQVSPCKSPCIFSLFHFNLTESLLPFNDKIFVNSDNVLIDSDVQQNVFVVIVMFELQASLLSVVTRI